MRILRCRLSSWRVTLSDSGAARHDGRNLHIPVFLLPSRQHCLNVSILLSSGSRHDLVLSAPRYSQPHSRVLLDIQPRTCRDSRSAAVPLWRRPADGRHRRVPSLFVIVWPDEQTTLARALARPQGIENVSMMRAGGRDGRGWAQQSPEHA